MEFFLEFMSLTRFSDLSFEVVMVVPLVVPPVVLLFVPLVVPMVVLSKIERNLHDFPVSALTFMGL